MTDTPPSSTPQIKQTPNGVRSPVVLESMPVARLATAFTGLALLAALLALVMAGMMWQRLSMTQQELARRQQDSDVRTASAVEQARQTEALTQELQARLAVAEVKLSEVVLQRSQLDELMLNLSRSRDDTLVQDLESGLRLALQQAQLTGSAQPLVSALQAADQRIARVAQARLNPVQRAIARDIERLQSAELTDVPSLVQRLGELARTSDQWPLANDMLTATTPAALPSPKKSSVPPQPVDANVESMWSRGWRAVWHGIRQSLRDLIRVSRIDHPEAALLAPEQSYFLRENIKLQLLNARMGVLARQQASAQADLKAVQSLLKRYFDVQSPSVKTALVTLTQLHEQMMLADMPRPDETLTALAALAGGR